MTEDSPGRARGYGPFPEGAEPTAPIPAQPTGAEQQAYAAPAPSDDSPAHPASEEPASTEHGAADGEGRSVSPQTANVPPSAQNGETSAASASGRPSYGQPYGQPAGAQPGYTQASDSRSGHVQESGSQPAEVQPGYVQPSDSRPGSALPGHVHDSGSQPTEGQPGYTQASDSQPGSDRPGSDRPGSDRPGSDQPGSIEPGRLQERGSPPGSAQGGVAPQGSPQVAYGEPVGGEAPIAGAQPTSPDAQAPGYDSEATVSYQPQPTTSYPITPTGMNPHAALPSGTNPHEAGPSGAAYPSGPATYGAAPAAGATPTSGTPMSGSPYPDPSSGAPYPTSGGDTPSYGPFHSDNTTWDTTPFPGRRIEPSPPPDRSRLLIGLLAGLIAGLLVFGVAGFFTGRLTAPAAPAAPASSLGAFERSQLALNRPHFASTGLVAISQGWLPYLSSCTRSGESGGPALNAGEKARVRCTLYGMSAIFVEYNSIADRDKARVTTLGQNVDARTLTPGVGPVSQRSAPSGRTKGNYVEYAYKLTEGGVTRPVAAIWWDDAQTPVAGYLLAYWKEGLGESWDPMRDLWARYA